jgi:hypothetical protein
MFRKSYILISLIVFITAGCIKETYNLKKLSGSAQLSPTVGVAAAYGDISLSDILKASDTVVFGSDKFVKLVFKKDSVVYYKLSDYYDLNNMVSYSDSYTIGELSMSPFSGTVYPVANTAELPFPTFSNFESATLSQGVLDITVRNNTATVINTITITIYNISPHQQLGIPGTISAINPGQTGTTSINLANLTFIKNSTSVAYAINPGSLIPNGNVAITMAGRDMKVKSGKLIVTPQTLNTFQSNDTIPFNPGTGVEISYIKMTSGNISYSLNSNTQLTGTVSLTLPSTLRSGIPISETLTAVANKTVTGAISVNNSTIDLGTKTSQPYNLLPIVSTVSISSGGNMVTFNSTDAVKLDLSFLNPVFDYVKGYFGQQTESINKDTLDLGIKDILDRITGSFLVASPSINLNYTNSFAIPIQITLDAAGYRKSNVVQLGLAPVTLGYPAAPAERIKTDVFTINKSNSQLPQLISMPPEKVVFSGNAKMNPSGNTGARNNYLFNNSYFLGNLEIVVPLEFRLNNLQFADTVDNFMKDQTGDSPIKPEDFEFLRLDITADNGFPLGFSLNMILYDSTTHSNKCTIDATDVLKAATVDSNGKVTASVSSATSITINQDFWKYVNTADKIIFRFSMNTTNSSSQDIKIYSDYKINFKAAVVLKPVIKFDLKK